MRARPVMVPEWLLSIHIERGGWQADACGYRYLAVYVVATAGATMTCVCAPPSDHDPKL